MMYFVSFPFTCMRRWWQYIVRQYVTKRVYWKLCVLPCEGYSTTYWTNMYGCADHLFTWTTWSESYMTTSCHTVTGRMSSTDLLRVSRQNRLMKVVRIEFMVEHTHTVQPNESCLLVRNSARILICLNCTIRASTNLASFSLFWFMSSASI